MERETCSICENVIPECDRHHGGLCVFCYMERRETLGGSDVAAAMGMSRWKTPLRLWSEKTGRIMPDDLSENEAVELGKELEEFVAKKFERETGLKVRRAPQNYTDKEFSWMRCQVDRLVTGMDELLEVKTCSAWKEKEWAGEDIPQEYILQVQYQLMITGRSIGWIAVLIGGQKFRHKKILADLELQDTIRKRAVEFWHMVTNDVMPIVRADDDEMLLSLYPKSNDEIQLVEEMNASIKLLKEIQMHIGELENQEAEIKNKLKAVIGENMGVKTSEYVVSWKPQVSKRVDVDFLKKNYEHIYTQCLKDSATRILRIAANKQGGK